jgi:hypothetical protein
MAVLGGGQGDMYFLIVGSVGDTLEHVGIIWVEAVVGA